MEMKKLELEVPKEMYEVGEGVKTILVAIANAIKDGWQPAQDIPPILASSFSALMLAVEGCTNIPEEIEAMPVTAIKGAVLPITDGIEEMIKVFKK